MLPAARLGDLTAHGTPLGPGPGSPNVLIQGQPAWRAGVDVHACPYHGAGAVTMGSPTVLINNIPAARMSDTAIEGSPPAAVPNVISMGAPTVLIG